MENERRFFNTLYAFGERISDILGKLPATLKNNTEEIRLRKGLPLAVTVNGDTVFLKANGGISFDFKDDLAVVTPRDIEESYKRLCGSSAFAHTEQIKDGYIIMKNGNRAGICGEFTDNGFIKDVKAINVRIAREIFGAANDIVKNFEGESILIAGPPGCGKTTVLRDLIRQLSGGINGKYYRTAVIDSRGEISGGGVNDLGYCTDLISIKDKAKGIEIALRTMFPEIIAFDEIGSLSELERVKESMFSGTTVITTAHIGSAEELFEREITRKLITEGIVKKTVLLPRLHGGKLEIINSEKRESYVKT